MKLAVMGNEGGSPFRYGYWQLPDFVHNSQHRRANAGVARNRGPVNHRVVTADNHHGDLAKPALHRRKIFVGPCLVEILHQVPVGLGGMRQRHGLASEIATDRLEGRIQQFLRANHFRFILNAGTGQQHGQNHAGKDQQYRHDRRYQRPQGHGAESKIVFLVRQY